MLSAHPPTSSLLLSCLHHLQQNVAFKSLPLHNYFMSAMTWGSSWIVVGAPAIMHVVLVLGSARVPEYPQCSGKGLHGYGYGVQNSDPWLYCTRNRITGSDRYFNLHFITQNKHIHS
jgi:hypothetical protein